MDWTRRCAIGHGSSATVSLATSLSGDIFAAKSAELPESELLQREQKILSSLNSPRIITYKGCDITSENNRLMYNLFMEYAAGGTLTDAIRRHNGGGGRLNELLIVYYTRQILQGLEYLHSNGLVHCDIKARNILITESGAKIADFGCAKLQSEEVGVGGTPMFMAPEVARGEQQGFASDVWAVGCTVIEMASGGGAPWSNVTDPVTVLYRIAYSSEMPELPGCLSNQAKDFLSKCLRRDPKERWTATQLLNHPFLEEFNSCTKKPIQESSTSNSPTSILDQDIWNSSSSSSVEVEMIRSSSQNSSVSERIRRLSVTDQEGPSWSWDDESWITIRGISSITTTTTTTTIMDEIDGSKDDMICGSVLDSISGGLQRQESHYYSEKLVLDFLDNNITISNSNSRISCENFCGLCTYNKNIVVIRDRLLPPLISISSIS
ncbi:hypothetical protein ACOSQ2_002723 [Xanthoceras sorbifolium]